jgi:pimeloyl-ACP methyl ester carboxylesterase
VADRYISLNAHPGRPEVLTAWMDPSVVDEADPLSRDPSLDMFDPANGPPYAPEFVSRYREAQVARNQRITAWARDELVRLDEAGAVDRVFDVHRVWADLRFLDLTLDPSERTAGCYAGDPRRANAGPLGIGRTNTLQTWLSMWSLEASDCRGTPHLARIDVPSLVVQSLGDRGVFPSDARAIFESIGTGEKRLELVPGAHYFEEGEERRAEIARLLVDWLGDV